MITTNNDKEKMHIKKEPLPQQQQQKQIILARKLNKQNIVNCNEKDFVLQETSLQYLSYFTDFRVFCYYQLSNHVSLAYRDLFELQVTWKI